jgi:uncharacterized membrane protein
MPALRPVPLAAGAVMLAGLTINSHAWGSGLLAVAGDWIHMLAVGIWIGGLGCVVVILLGAAGADRAVLARAVVPGFSRTAVISLAAVVLTGLYASWLHVGSLKAFTMTGYGRYLLTKLAFVIPLAALGAVNRFLFRPRIESGAATRGSPLVGRFLGVAGGEVALAAVVLLVVAALTATPPANVSLDASVAASAGLRFLGDAEGARLSLAVNPAQPGPNRIEVTATGRDGQSVEEPARVLLRLVKLDEELVPSTVTLAPAGQGRFVAEGGVTIPPGWWEAEVILRQRGALDRSTSFPLQIGTPAAASSDPAAAALLQRAQARMAEVRGWREVEQVTDGAGGTVIARIELLRPDRLRIRTSSGTEAILIDTTRYVKEGSGAWRRETLSRSIAAEGALQYLRDAESVVFGRQAPCETEACRVVLWEAPGRAAAFAAWIGAESRLIHKVLMVAPQHYMTAHLRDFNAPIRIEAPQ